MSNSCTYRHAGFATNASSRVNFDAPVERFAIGQVWQTRNGSIVKIIAVDLGQLSLKSAYPIGGIVFEDGDTYLDTFTADGAYCDAGAPTGLDTVHLLSHTHEEL